MKKTFRNALLNLIAVAEIEIFRTSFRTLWHFSALWFSLIGCFKELKKAIYASISSNIALYPGRESNPHLLNGDRILSPACLPVPPPGHFKKQKGGNGSMQLESVLLPAAASCLLN